MPSHSNRSRGDDSPNSSPQFHPGFDPGILPVIPDGTPPPDKPPTSNAATGASAAGVRALTSQAVAFYFRAPVKAFFRTRVDYLAYARALQEQEHAARHPHQAAAALSSSSPSPTTLTPSSSSPATSTPSTAPTTTRWTSTHHWLRSRLRSTTPAVLASAVRHYGWRVVPDQILPPLVANVGVGAVLYTSYLQILGRLHPESARASKRVYPPPGPGDAFAAGFLAGGIQSVVAAPLDAVQARWDGVMGGRVAQVVGGGGGGAAAAVQRPRSMWAFSAAKLREIGVRGVFSGWGLSFLKDSMGSAVFFSVFEYVKAQGYYNFVRWYYGSLNEDTIVLLSRKRPAPEDGPQLQSRSEEEPSMPTVIRPHYAIEPAFLLLAGMGASVTQQAILHPLSHVQSEHWERLEALDAKAAKLRVEAGLPGAPPNPASRWLMLRAYRAAYRKTWAECMAEAEAAGLGMRQWLYRGFWWNTVRQVPSTSAGLIIFELVRRKYGLGGDQVRINRDGYDILLH